jgi:site-specific recombinase XerD
MYLTKRSNGYYYVGFFLDDKLHWKTTGQKTKPEALEFLKSFNPNPEEKKSELTLSQLLDLFSKLHGSSLRKRTLVGYESATNEFIRVLGDRLLSRYTSQDIETFKQNLLSRKLTATSVNIRYRSIKAVFGFALRHEHIIKSPFAKTSAIKMAQRTPLYLTKEDLNKLFEKVTNPLMKDLFLFGALTGMRLSEIVNLKWKSIDWKKNQIVVSNDDDFTTKSGKERVVPIHTTVLEILKRRAAKKKHTEYVFSKSTGFKFSESYVSHEFKFYVGEAKLDTRLHFHSLRHTTASHLVNAGVSIYEVQKILGHSSVATTMIYSHLAQSTLADSIKKLDL